MSTNLPKSDLITFVASQAGVSKAQAQAVLDALGPVIRTNAANGYTITLPGLGRFSEKVRAARTGRNPATGQPVEIAESRTLGFKAGKAKAP
ncbi:HU family DNA-binding protein [Paracoccaceae bacterium]